MKNLMRIVFLLTPFALVGPANAILIDFETKSGYGPTDGANIMSPAQPSSGSKWSSNLSAMPAYTWKATGGYNDSACMFMNGNVATNYTQANFLPSAADWGLASLTPADQQVWFGVKVRMHRNDGNSGRTPLSMTFMRDTGNPNRGRGLRMSIRQNGAITIVNSLGPTYSNVFSDTNAFVHIVGMLDYSAKTGTVSLGETVVHNFSFINEAGTGVDEYGSLNTGSSLPIDNVGYDFTFDDYWFGTTPPPPDPPLPTVIAIR